MPMQIRSVSKSFGTDVILENITMTISDNQKIGLIGANGAGKTTLLKIISGEMSCDSGSVFTPKDAEIGFLKQTAIADSDNTMAEEIDEIFADINAIENEMRAIENKMSKQDDLSENEHLMKMYASLSAKFDAKGGFDVQTTVKTVMNGMGFDKFDLKTTKASTLSGGEKTKFAFAKLLLRHPQVLLLDEPTNHLDFRTMQWLENYLKSYSGIVIAVSHDRYFLDSIADCIYEIERGTAVKYSGNYSAYLNEKKKNYEIALKHYEEQNAEIQKLEDYVARNKVRASTAKMAKSKQKAIDRMEFLEKPVLYNKECKFEFKLEYPSYKDVLECDNLELIVGDEDNRKTIAKNISFNVKRGEKVAIIGANGIGKSTLLKTLVGINKMYKGNFEFGKNTDISFYDQQQKLLHENKNVLGEIWDRFPRMDESDVRTLLGTVLFTNDDVYKEVSRLSGGERARLMLLVIMLQKANTMLLDEPTNHLDLPSKEALDFAVKNFDGSVILVSHDRYFLNKTADRILELSSDKIISYEGNYDSYLDSKNSITSSEPIYSKKSDAASIYENNKRKAANKRNAKRKLKSIEEEISKSEKENEEIKNLISEAGSDYGKVSELYKQGQETEKHLAELYESWETLSGILENDDF